MTKEEYTAAQKELAEKHRIERLELAKEYALSNNQYKAGDIITDHIGSIRIERVGFYIGLNNNPECTYYGDNLLKSGAISKREPKRTVHQSNIV